VETPPKLNLLGWAVCELLHFARSWSAGLLAISNWHPELVALETRMHSPWGMPVLVWFEGVRINSFGRFRFCVGIVDRTYWFWTFIGSICPYHMFCRARAFRLALLERVDLESAHCC